MTIERMSLVSSIDPDSYKGGFIEAGAGTKNILYTRYPGEKIYASQRPSIEINTSPIDDDKELGKGRGLVYWNIVDDYYIVQNDTIYKGGFSNPIGTISAGIDKVFFVEVSEQLAIIDPANNEAWYVDSSLPLVVNKVTDANFPGNLPNKQLVGGGASLNGYLFVMTKDGFIYNSNLNVVQTWNAIDFISSDISADGGVFITRHHNNICVIGESSIEFFYDAGNPLGSPLQLRRDISYLEGAIEVNAVSNNGDEVIFLGRKSSGTIGLYRLSQFTVTHVSNDSIDRFIGDSYNSRTDDGFDIKFIVSTAWFGKHLLCFITSVKATGESYTPIYTLVYDVINELWTRFDTKLDEIDQFCVVDSTDSSGTSFIKGSLLFESGSVGSVILSGDVTDAISSIGYIVDGYIDSNYFVRGRETIRKEIDINITTIELDYQRMTYKQQHRMSIVGSTTASGIGSSDLEISWTDDRYKTFSKRRLMDTGLRRSLPRLGTFKRRAFSIDYSGRDQLRLEKLELYSRSSQYA